MTESSERLINIESNGKVIGSVKVPLHYADALIDDVVAEWVADHFKILWEEVEE